MCKETCKNTRNKQEQNVCGNSNMSGNVFTLSGNVRECLQKQKESNTYMEAFERSEEFHTNLQLKSLNEKTDLEKIRQGLKYFQEKIRCYLSKVRKPLKQIRHVLKRIEPSLKSSAKLKETAGQIYKVSKHAGGTTRSETNPKKPEKVR